MHNVEQRDISTVIHVDADLDIGSSPALDSAIRLAESAQAERIVVSLEHCSYCDATGLTVLVNAHKRNGAKLSIVVPDDGPCRRVFEVTGLARALPIVSSLPTALGEFPAVRSSRLTLMVNPHALGSTGARPRGAGWGSSHFNGWAISPRRAALRPAR